jgi:hypothetical protein
MTTELDLVGGWEVKTWFKGLVSAVQKYQIEIPDIFFVLEDQAGILSLGIAKGNGESIIFRILRHHHSHLGKFTHVA